MADLHVDIHVIVTNRLQWLKCCRKAGISGEKLMELAEDTTTTILNYPGTIHVETRNAWIKSIREHSDLFTFQVTEAMVDGINELRTRQHDTVDDSVATVDDQP